MREQMSSLYFDTAIAVSKPSPWCRPSRLPEEATWCSGQTSRLLEPTSSTRRSPHLQQRAHGRRPRREVTETIFPSTEPRRSRLHHSLALDQRFHRPQTDLPSAAAELRPPLQLSPVLAEIAVWTPLRSHACRPGQGWSSWVALKRPQVTSSSTPPDRKPVPASPHDDPATGGDSTAPHA
jgi:hypothetical protein